MHPPDSTPSTPVPGAGVPPSASAARSKAWTCLFTNLLVLPGLGSLMARRWVGVPQTVVALIGFILFIVPVWWWFREVFRTLELPTDVGPRLWWVAGGIALMTGAWLWALLTSLDVLRTSNPATPASEPPEEA